jgi:predicted nucleic acid-binding Zn ribbon protein
MRDAGPVPWEPLPGKGDDEPSSLGEGLEPVMRRLGGPSVAAVDGVFGRWDEIVGERLAAHARPVSLRDGRLVVAVDDPAWATQVRYLEAQVLGRVAEVLGAGEVSAIDVRVRPSRAGREGRRDE